MPKWNRAPEATLDGVIDQALKDLNLDTDNPSMEEMIGLSMDQLSNHSARVLLAYQQSGADLADPMSLIQIYALGFTIGTKYGERRASDS